MPVVVAMLRGINLGTRRRVGMEKLRALYESLGLKDVRTYVQSGNIVFRTDVRDLTKLTARLERAFEQTFGFHSDVITRSASELKSVIARNPFAKRRGVEASKLLVTFLAADPGEKAREQVRGIKTSPEEVHIEGSELYVYFPNGVGRSKLPSAALERVLGTSGTARNWNSVTKLLAMAEELEGSSR